jgi:hypothetical protein
MRAISGKLTSSNVRIYAGESGGADDHHGPITANVAAKMPVLNTPAAAVVPQDTVTTILPILAIHAIVFLCGWPFQLCSDGFNAYKDAAEG